MLLLTTAALARPLEIAPDLSFQQTPLPAPDCTPGTEATWELHQEVKGRAHGRDVQTGDLFDSPIHTRTHFRVRIRCLTQAPLTIAITPQWKDGERWQEAPYSATFSVPAWTTVAFVEVQAGSEEDRAAAERWRYGVPAWLPWLFPPMATTAPAEGQTWDGAWPLDLGPWWDCHGAVTAGGVVKGLREYTLDGRCESISYWGRNRLQGTFSRPDGGFGVQTAAWTVSSLWEHHMVYNDTDWTVSVTRVE